MYLGDSEEPLRHTQQLIVTICLKQFLHLSLDFPACLPDMNLILPDPLTQRESVPRPRMVHVDTTTTNVRTVGIIPFELFMHSITLIEPICLQTDQHLLSQQQHLIVKIRKGLFHLLSRPPLFRH